jgi:regulation of enolase protein 1 (concanavalin A-like superfamily)
VHRRIRLWVDDHLVIDQWKGEGGEYNSDKVPMVAGKKVPFKVEYTSPNGFMLCRLRWSSKSQPRDTIPASAFSVAPDEKLGRPVVGMVYPTDDSFVAAPSSLAILATALTPNGRIQKLQFYNLNSPIAELESQPFRFIWNKPPPGVYQLRAKVTDAAGVTAMSRPASLTITGRGDGSLKAPWGDFYIANNDSKTPGTASQKGDAFKIDNAIGTLVSESEHDAGHFIVQPLNGDGQIIARVTSVLPGPDDGIAGAMAGVTIRENLKNRCKQFAMLYGQAGEEPSVQFARRQDHWMNPLVSEKAMKAPAWIKLARYGQRIYAYTSADGKDWDLFASERFEAAPQVFAGLVAFSPSSNHPATAQFDHVKLIPGAPALESAVKGFVTRGGTFVAADVYAIDQNLVRYMRDNAQGAVPLNDVARILYKPLLLDHAEKLSPGRQGLLMSTGDFLEGDVRALKDGTVSVSSVLFGLRKVPIYDELTAVILHDVASEKTPFTLTTTDGSTYRPKSLKPTLQTLQIDDASLGQLTIPLGMLAQLWAQ